MLRSLELFAGAGGLALGTELAGFHAIAAVERDHWACETLMVNQLRDYPLVRNLQVIQGDVRTVDLSHIPRGIDLVSGGPPCQPFSIGGKGLGFNDDRDMFSAFSNVVADIKPRAFIIENVRGLMRESFSNYLAYIELRMSMPEIRQKPDEAWPDHFKRLEREHTSIGSKGVRYHVLRELFNAADFGAPQKRHRVFIVGFREDQDVKWSFPLASHSEDALIFEKWVNGNYWDRHSISRKSPSSLNNQLLRRIDRLGSRNDFCYTQPWLTIRDALRGLPEPTDTVCDTSMISNHRFQGGARIYSGHTGSPIDEPSKALKAGDHGVPGGENMLVREDGSVRYFSVREAARLQGFPDGYVFHGSWTETMRQLGNAVPVMLAQAIASSVATHLTRADIEKTAFTNRRIN